MKSSKVRNLSWVQWLHDARGERGSVSFHQPSLAHSCHPWCHRIAALLLGRRQWKYYLRPRQEELEEGRTKCIYQYVPPQPPPSRPIHSCLLRSLLESLKQKRLFSQWPELGQMTTSTEELGSICLTLPPD